MPLVYFENELVDWEKIPLYKAARLRYGDSLFESLLYINKEIPLLDYHLKRMRKSAHLLNLDFPSTNIRAVIEQLILKNDIKTNARVRLTLIRSKGDLYTPNTSEARFLVEVFPYEKDLFRPCENLGVYQEHKKGFSNLSNLKSGNALIYVMAKQALQHSVYDDLVLLQEGDIISEATSSNIFMFKGNNIFTPSLKTACVSGVMRSFVMEMLEVEEISMTLNKLNTFDEIFLTNAVRLIQPVNQWNGKKLVTQQTQKLISKTRKELQA